MIFQLGLPGNLQDIPQESLKYNGVKIKDPNKTAESADNTLHVNFRPIKLNPSFTYDIISEANYDLLKSIYDSQIGTVESLQFKTDKEDGTPVTYSVYMPMPPHGAVIRDSEPRYYYNVKMELRER